MNPSGEFSRLPLEVVGLIFLQLNDVSQLDELKKCRLVSPRFYKAVKNFFQDEFSQKLCSHFDGSKYNFTKSRSFGMNLFGSYKLNFPTVKISKAEYYLMKSWLEKMVPTNVNNLELKDNFLNWKELIMVLRKFTHIVNLKFIQTFKFVYGVYDDQTLELFKIPCAPITGCYREKIQKEFENDHEDFLPNLKNFSAEIVHVSNLNVLGCILSFSTCELESFSIKINLTSLIEHNYWLRHYQFISFYDWLMKNSEKMKLLEINSLSQLKKFSKTLKIFEIIVDDSKVRDEHSSVEMSTILGQSFLNMFSKPDELQMFKLEKLVIKGLHFGINFFEDDDKGFCQFINQKCVENVEFSMTNNDVLMARMKSEPEAQEKVKNFLKTLMISNKSTFGHCLNHWGFDFIDEFSEHVDSLKLLLNKKYNRLNEDIPVFKNCSSLYIKTYDFNWFDHSPEAQHMINKFPNLVHLVICHSYRSWSNENDTHFTNDNLQSIIKNYKNLKSLYLENMSSYFDDAALTGLKLEAIESRKENPSAPIGPDDLTGLPISHLKNLESLIIKSENVRIPLTDITAHHAFINMVKLKKLDIFYTKITREGFQAILGKTGSKNLNIKQLTTYQFTPRFTEEDDEDEDENEDENDNNNDNDGDSGSNDENDL